MRKNRILITGATGFVGQHVLSKLIELGYPLTVITRDRARIPVNHLPSSCQIIETQNLFLENFEWFKQSLVGVETVLHIAWHIEPSEYQSLLNYDCLSGTLLLARAAADMQVKKFVGIGTCFEYDLDYGNLSTATPLKASSIYSAAKISTFLSLTELFKNKETPFLWCRLFYLFGEGENPKRLVSYVRSRIQAGEPVELTSGDQIRDYLDVKEAANVIVESTLSEKSGPINICSSIPITVRELVERIADEYNRRDLLRFGSRPENQIDPKVIVGIKT